jgi:hypothetical protein
MFPTVLVLGDFGLETFRDDGARGSLLVSGGARVADSGWVGEEGGHFRGAS